MKELIVFTTNAVTFHISRMMAFVTQTQVRTVAIPEQIAYVKVEHNAKHQVAEEQMKRDVLLTAEMAIVRKHLNKVYVKRIAAGVVIVYVKSERVVHLVPKIAVHVGKLLVMKNCRGIRNRNNPHNRHQILIGNGQAL